MSTPCDLRIVFLGTRDFALPSLRLLVERKYSVVGVVTQPDRPTGRHRQIEANSIQRFAAEHGLPICQPEDANDRQSIEVIRRWHPDLLVLVAYGQILKPTTLETARRGGINLHGSLLPRYRGAAPVAWAIYHGESQTGVTVIQLAPKVDAGSILASLTTDIFPEETAGELEARLGELGAPLLCSVIDGVATNTIEAIPQDADHASWARQLKKTDGLIDWSRPAHQVCNQVRAMHPWPAAYTTFESRSSRRVVRVIIPKVVQGPDTGGAEEPGTIIGSMRGTIQVQTGRATSVFVGQIQPADKRMMTPAEFQNGYHVAPGDRFRAPAEALAQLAPDQDGAQMPCLQPASTGMSKS